MSIDKQPFLEATPWDFEALQTEFESRVVETSEDGTVPGHRLLADYQANLPYADFRGKISWAQTVITEHPDAVFARLREESPRFTAHAPIEHAEEVRRSSSIGRFVSKITGRG